MGQGTSGWKPRLRVAGLHGAVRPPSVRRGRVLMRVGCGPPRKRQCSRVPRALQRGPRKWASVRRRPRTGVPHLHLHRHLRLRLRRHRLPPRDPPRRRHRPRSRHRLRQRLPGPPPLRRLAPPRRCRRAPHRRFLRARLGVRRPPGRHRPCRFRARTLPRLWTPGSHGMGVNGPDPREGGRRRPAARPMPGPGWALGPQRRVIAGWMPVAERVLNRLPQGPGDRNPRQVRPIRPPSRPEQAMARSVLIETAA